MLLHHRPWLLFFALIAIGSGSACKDDPGSCVRDCSGPCCAFDGCGERCTDACGAGMVCDLDACACRPVPTRGIGEACEEDGECFSGLCFRSLLTDESYCSTADCLDHADCVNTSGDGAGMCCVSSLLFDRVCEKTAPGQACAAPALGCGGICDNTGSSACLAGMFCIRPYCHASCLKRCETDADCADCQLAEDPLDVFLCVPLREGETACLPTGERFSCQRSSECCDLRDEVCVPYWSGGFALSGECITRFGDLQPGEPCDSEADPGTLPEEERCAAYYCLDDLCSEVCGDDDDCPDNMVCGVLEIVLDDAGEHIEAINMCRAKP